MITTQKCEKCNCDTKYDKIDVQIDEEIKNDNNVRFNEYKHEFDMYERQVESITRDFKERINEHNAKVRWWNFKTNWYFYERTCLYTTLEIKEEESWSYEYIEQLEVSKPSFNPKLYQYIECPICGERRYFK